MPLERGRLALVFYNLPPEDGPVWHQRLVLAGLESSETTAVVLTPDYDCYLEDLSA